MRQIFSTVLARFSGACAATALRAAILLMRLLGPAASSALGGWLARTLGPWLSSSRTADRNLVRALPALAAPERDGIIRAVWDNLGRNVAELPHLGSFRRTAAGPGWEVEGEQHIDTLKASGGQALFFSGHLGNWEMILPIAAAVGLPVSGFYRAASDVRIDRLIQAMRQHANGPASTMFAKGAGGARGALHHLENGSSLGLLIDQKMNDGISVPFFGRPAMTAPALAQLARRFRLPVLPVYVVRLEPQRFRLVCEAPLPIRYTADRAADVRALSAAANATLERWIRARPGAWLWLHRRWPKEPLAVATPSG